MTKKLFLLAGAWVVCVSHTLRHRETDTARIGINSDQALALPSVFVSHKNPDEPRIVTIEEAAIAMAKEGHKAAKKSRRRPVVPQGPVNAPKDKLYITRRQTMSSWYSGLMNMAIDEEYIRESGSRILLLGGFRKSHPALEELLRGSGLLTFGFSRREVPHLDRYAQGTYKSMPFQDETFNIIHNFNDVGKADSDTGHKTHLEREFIQEIYRITEFGGYLITDGTLEFLSTVRVVGFKRTVFKTEEGIPVWLKPFKEAA